MKSRSRLNRAQKWYLGPFLPTACSLASLGLLGGTAWYISRYFPGHFLGLSFGLIIVVSLLIVLIAALLWVLLYQLLRLHESRENLRLTIQSSTDMVFLMDGAGRYLEIFAASDEKLAARPSDMRGRSVREVLGEELGQRVESTIVAVMASGEKQTLEYSFPIGGQSLWFEAVVSKRDNESVVAMIRDRTREKNLTLQLEEQRLFMENILNSISDPIFIKDDQHRWLYGNDAFNALLGRTPSEYYGKTDNDFFPPEIANVFYDSDRRTFSEMKDFEQEEPILDVHGQRRSILTKKTPFIGLQGKKTLVGVIRDITERKEMERQIGDERARQIAASRLASLGEMAGGVAHEINNPLAIISGYTARLTDVLSREPIDKKRALEISTRIESTTLRIATIVKGLRSIARDGSFDPKEITAVAAIISETLGLCSERFRNQGVKIESDISSGLFVLVRSVQMSQVLLNLLTNAYYAASQSSDALIGVQAYQSGSHVEISVTDSGAGVAPGIRERIFEPFFTTKPVGLGTGLGLSIAASIVREHDGDLFLDTKSDRTRFVIRLPAV